MHLPRVFSLFAAEPPFSLPTFFLGQPAYYVENRPVLSISCLSFFFKKKKKKDRIYDNKIYSKKGKSILIVFRSILFTGTSEITISKRNASSVESFNAKLNTFRGRERIGRLVESKIKINRYASIRIFDTTVFLDRDREQMANQSKQDSKVRKTVEYQERTVDGWFSLPSCAPIIPDVAQNEAISRPDCQILAQLLGSQKNSAGGGGSVFHGKRRNLGIGNGNGKGKERGIAINSTERRSLIDS